MRYAVEVGSKASNDLAALDASVGPAVERKILWLADNAELMVHRRLVGMPEDLAGLCKLRLRDYRILYWVTHSEKVVRIYRVQHRSEVYRRL
jgi:mRNA-degrading endonuclease RelE of RelBE toxin-antitoxin system